MGDSMKLKQPLLALPLGVAQGQPHEYGGKGLSGERALEKRLIIELGWAQPVSFFSCPDWLLPLRDVAEGTASAAVETQTQVSPGATSPQATSVKGPRAAGR